MVAGGSGARASSKSKVYSKVYSYRWYALAVFSLVSAAQNIVWNTWGPIAVSAEQVYEWDDATIALMSNWGPITFIFSTPFLTWLMDEKGMRKTLLLSSFLLMAGTGLRCIPANTINKTMFIHLGQFLNGIPGPVVMGGAPLVSATWFPVHQRTTATAIASISGGFGVALSFVFGPMLVKDLSSQLESANERETGLSRMQSEIEHYLFLSFLGCTLLFLLVVFTFQNKPRNPPSLTASYEKLDYKSGVLALVRNEKFWTLASVFGISLGIYSCYMPVLEVMLKKKSITQEESGALGFYSSIAGNMSALILARFADAFKRRMRVYILTLYAVALISYGIFSMAYQDWWFVFTKDLMYLTQTMGSICLSAGAPLLLELSCEVTYPVAEGVTAGFVTWLSNLAGLIFLFILMIPDVGTSWMNWCLTFGVAACIPALLLFKDRFSRPD